MERLAGSTINKGFNDESGRLIRMKEEQNIWRKVGLLNDLAIAQGQPENRRNQGLISHFCMEIEWIAMP